MTERNEGEPWLRLTLAGLVVECRLPTERDAAALRDRWRAYLTERAPDWVVSVAITPELSAPQQGWIEHDGARTRFQIWTHAGEVDFSGRRATVEVQSRAELRPGLERTIVYVLIHELPRTADALLIHGSGIVRDGVGEIFFGASGRGKSTVSRLAEGIGEVLSDENVIVQLRGDVVELVSTPFWGMGTPDDLLRQLSYRRVPLRRLYSLEHAANFEVERLAPGAAAMALLTSEKIATARRESATDWLNVVDRLVARVPLYRLGFRPTVELWSYLDRTLEAK